MRGSNLDNPRSAAAAEGIWTIVAESTSLNRFLAIVALFALTISPIVGTLAAALFVGVSLACIALQPADIATAMVRFWPIFLLSIVAILSTMWSDAPERTLRAGIQLLITFVAAIAICRRLDSSTMILALFASFLAIDLLATLSVPRSLSLGMPLIGPFGSKNAMGITAEIHLALSVALLCDPPQRWPWRIAAIASIPLAVGLIVLAQSAGAVTSSVLFIVLFLVLATLAKVPSRARILLVMLAFVLLALSVAFSADIVGAVNSFRQDVLHKDASLTGRTYLWNYADGLIAQRPLLGHGYYAFWRQGNVEAEGLWRWGGIASRSGFNFHNAMIEMQVDLGMVGLVVFLASCAAVLGYALYRHIVKPSVPLAFLLAMTIVFYIRSYAESGLFAPFSLPTILWVATLVYAAGDKAARAMHPGARGRPRTARMPRYAAGSARGGVGGAR